MINSKQIWLGSDSESKRMSKIIMERVFTKLQICFLAAVIPFPFFVGRHGIAVSCWLYPQQVTSFPSIFQCFSLYFSHNTYLWQDCFAVHKVENWKIE